MNGKRNGRTAYTLQEVRDDSSVLGFGPQNTSADAELTSVMNQYVQILQQAQMVSEEAFQAAFEDFVQKYDNLSLRQFLQEKAGQHAATLHSGSVTPEVWDLPL